MSLISKGEPNAFIFDFETMSQDVRRGALLSIGMLLFDDRVFTQSDPYTYEDLLGAATYMKFNVGEQVQKYERNVDKQTVQWWKEQSKEVQEMIMPMASDVSILKLIEIIDDFDWTRIKRVWTRGNTFDPIILDNLYQQFGKKNPYGWWKLRDTRSFINGMSIGTKMRDDFMPPEPVDLEKKLSIHNPVDDIILDVLRMQYLTRTILL